MPQPTPPTILAPIFAPISLVHAIVSIVSIQVDSIHTISTPTFAANFISVKATMIKDVCDFPFFTFKIGSSSSPILSHF